MSSCTTPDLCFPGDFQNVVARKECCPLHTSMPKLFPIHKLDLIDTIYQQLQSKCVPVTEVTTSGKGVLHRVPTSPPVIHVEHSERLLCPCPP